MIQSPFIPDELYKRPLIHDVYGGTRQDVQYLELHNNIFK